MVVVIKIPEKIIILVLFFPKIYFPEWTFLGVISQEFNFANWQVQNFREYLCSQITISQTFREVFFSWKLIILK